MVVRKSCKLVGAGLAAGSAVSLPPTRLLESLLFEVRPTDAATMGTSAAVPVAAALVASYVPAPRAAGVDPMAALRCAWRHRFKWFWLQVRG